MTVLTFNVVGNNLRRTDTNKIVSVTRNNVTATFEFNSDWDSITPKVAQFANGEAYYDAFIEDGKCTVPWEVLENEGTLTVAVSGGDLITTNAVKINVYGTGLVGGLVPTAASPGVYSEITKLASEINDDYENMKSIMDTYEDTVNDSMTDINELAANAHESLVNASQKVQEVNSMYNDFKNEKENIVNNINELSEKKVGMGITVNSSNYEELNIHSIMDFPVNSVNKVYGNITEDMIGDLPLYGYNATLIRMNASIPGNSENAFCLYLFIAGSTCTVYFNFGSSDTHNIGWKEFITSKNIADIIVNNFEDTKYLKSNGYYSQSSLQESDINSIIDFPINSITGISNNITETDISKLPVYGQLASIIKYNVYNTNTTQNQFAVYFYVNIQGQAFYTFGNSSTGITNWHEIITPENIQEYLPNNIITSENVDNYMAGSNGFAFFSKFCSIGDSLSVGYYTDESGGQHNKDYMHSWPKYIEKICNTTPFWGGTSGQTCKSWLENTSSQSDWGLGYTRSLGVMPLYVISMGANEGSFAEGSEADIGTDNDTLYAYISKTIEELRAISPKSYIVCTGISRGQGINNRINAVYKNVCDHYDKCYYLNVEHELNSELFNSCYFKSHYSAIGYYEMAKLFGRKLYEVIMNNIDDFKYINDAENIE